MDAIVYTLPMIVVLFIAERLYSHRKHLQNFDYEECLSNITCGLGMSIFDMLFLPLLAAVYTTILAHTPFNITPTLMSGVLLFLLIDLLWYCYHRLTHQIPFLWSLHSVHHQPETFNISVGLRDSWFSRLGSWTIYLIPAFFGFPLAFYLILLGFQIGYNFWTHTTVITKMPKYFDWIFVSPAFHRVHHGKNARYINTNFGEVFSFWDRLFGTYVAETEPVIYGVTDQSVILNPLKACTHRWISHQKQTLFAYPAFLLAHKRLSITLLLSISLAAFALVVTAQVQGHTGLAIGFGLISLSLATLTGDLAGATPKD